MIVSLGVALELAITKLGNEELFFELDEFYFEKNICLFGILFVASAFFQM